MLPLDIMLGLWSSFDKLRLFKQARIMYECVVFDKDGTIFDTKHAAVNALQRASLELGVEYLPILLFSLVGMKSDHD